MCGVRVCVYVVCVCSVCVYIYLFVCAYLPNDSACFSCISPLFLSKFTKIRYTLTYKTITNTIDLRNA